MHFDCSFYCRLESFVSWLDLWRNLPRVMQTIRSEYSQLILCLLIGIISVVNKCMWQIKLTVIEMYCGCWCGAAGRLKSIHYRATFEDWFCSNQYSRCILQATTTWHEYEMNLKGNMKPEKAVGNSKTNSRVTCRAHYRILINICRVLSSSRRSFMILSQKITWSLQVIDVLEFNL